MLTDRENITLRRLLTETMQRDTEASRTLRTMRRQHQKEAESEPEKHEAILRQLDKKIRQLDLRWEEHMNLAKVTTTEYRSEQIARLSEVEAVTSAARRRAQDKAKQLQAGIQEMTALAEISEEQEEQIENERNAWKFEINRRDQAKRCWEWANTLLRTKK